MKVQTDLLSAQLVAESQRIQQQTDQIFEMVHPAAYYERPIPLRHPIAFYEGHIPAFNWNTLFRKIMGTPSFHPEFDTLFARGIDPANRERADELNQEHWPDRAQVQHYKKEIARRMNQYLCATDLSRPHHPLLKNGYVFYLMQEHELMHQETLMYILHQLPHSLKHLSNSFLPSRVDPAPPPQMAQIPDGVALLGAESGAFPFIWDNEWPASEVQVPGFAMDAYNVTNGAFLMFVETGGYDWPEFWEPDTWAWRTQNQIQKPFFWKKVGDEWFLRDFRKDIPLPLSWPVYVTHGEARAYARFVKKELPTEAEWHRAAYGDTPHHRYPWGNDVPTVEHGNFNFYRHSPTRVGSFPKGASPFGIYDLLGNGWEWTSTPFAPFPGFQVSEAYPQYSTDFFDGQHFVLKGGSPFTDIRLLRSSFRNWFYWHYPYAYTTFRCVMRH